ncbi:MAG: hypothetical protein K6T88_11260 [Bacillus sp. (in: Bacteria)]|nr:hypothetical protein [Bacillus sp. (in: firmicutes)]
MKRINRNSLPFMILFLIHSILLGLIFTKNKNRKQLFILLLSNIGVAYLFEFFVLNLLHAYIYKPKVVKNKVFDNIFGAVLSQAIFVPFTAVVLTSLRSKWLTKMATATYFVVIEFLFLWLGIYRHNWWKIVYTYLLLPFYFKWSDLWYDYMTKRNPIVRWVSLFLMILVTETNLNLLLAISRKVRFGFGRYHSWTEHFILVPLYSIVLSLFTTFSLSKENNLCARVRVILFEAVLSKFLEKKKLLKNNYLLIESLLLRFLMIFIYGQYKVLLFGDKNKEASIK